jgi:hypothetical protein
MGHLSCKLSTHIPVYVTESMIGQLLCVLPAQQYTWVGASGTSNTLSHTQP